MIIVWFLNIPYKYTRGTQNLIKALKLLFGLSLINLINFFPIDFTYIWKSINNKAPIQNSR